VVLSLALRAGLDPSKFAASGLHLFSHVWHLLANNRFRSANLMVSHTVYHTRYRPGKQNQGVSRMMAGRN